MLLYFAGDSELSNGVLLRNAWNVCTGVPDLLDFLSLAAAADGWN